MCRFVKCTILRKYRKAKNGVENETGARAKGMGKEGKGSRRVK